MSATFTNSGLQDLLEWLLNVNAPVTMDLDLYTDNHAPTNTSVIGDFTICTLGGYAQLVLTPASWGFASGGGIATGLFPNNTFVFNPYAGGTTIYGYVLSQGGVLVAAELFSSAYAVPSGGGSLTVGPAASLTYT